LLPSSKFFVTTDPKLILTLFPRFNPFDITAPRPTQESSPITVLPPKVVLEAIKHLSPTFTPCSI